MTCVSDPPTLFGCDVRRLSTRELSAGFDSDERLALGRALVLARVLDRLSLFGCAMRRLLTGELLAGFGSDERLALGRALVLARVLVGAVLGVAPRDDRAAGLAAEPLGGVADELLVAVRLGAELDLVDCERVRACDSCFPLERDADAEDPARPSRLVFASSMMVLRPLWWRS